MIYEYQGPYTKSRCQLEINGHVVVATEIAENPGMSITNSIGELAASVCRDFDIPPEKLVLIEHYGNESYHGGRDNKETYDMVEFSDGLGKPKWRPLRSDELRMYLKGWA